MKISHLILFSLHLHPYQRHFWRQVDRTVICALLKSVFYPVRLTHPLVTVCRFGDGQTGQIDISNRAVRYFPTSLYCYMVGRHAVMDMDLSL